MSTSNPQPGMAPAPMPAPPHAAPPRREEILVVSHCSLFYWWPVWAVGFLMGLITLFTGQYMVTVPKGTVPKQITMPGAEDPKKKNEVPKEESRDVLVVPHGTKLARDPANLEKLEEPHLLMSNNKNLGVLFIVVLLLVITITNIPLRGLWSVIVIVLIVSISIIFALLEWWEKILHYLNFLDIRINAAGYLVISSVLFVLWLIVVLLFDRQLYMVFTPGQLRVRLEIGDAETAFDTTGMTLQKQRSDLFRHWILGIGSGDLIVKTAGANAQEFHMNNVLFIGKKVNEIEEMLRSRQVVSGQSQ